MAESPELAAPAPAPSPAPSSPLPKSGIPPRYDLDAKWDACLDLSIRRVAYSSLAGAFTGLLLFRKEPPITLYLVRSGGAVLDMSAGVFVSLGLVRMLLFRFDPHARRARQAKMYPSGGLCANCIIT
jgi:hypothetical protein